MEITRLVVDVIRCIIVAVNIGWALAALVFALVDVPKQFRSSGFVEALLHAMTLIVLAVGCIAAGCAVLVDIWWPGILMAAWVICIILSLLG